MSASCETSDESDKLTVAMFDYVGSDVEVVMMFVRIKLVLQRRLEPCRSIADKEPIAPRSTLRVSLAANIYEDTVKRDENSMQPIARI